jgi:hypothetical protein
MERTKTMPMTTNPTTRNRFMTNSPIVDLRKFVSVRSSWAGAESSRALARTEHATGLTYGTAESGGAQAQTNNPTIAAACRGKTTGATVGARPTRQIASI